MTSLRLSWLLHFGPGPDTFQDSTVSAFESVNPSCDPWPPLAYHPQRYEPRGSFHQARPRRPSTPIRREPISCCRCFIRLWQVMACLALEAPQNSPMACSALRAVPLGALGRRKSTWAPCRFRCASHGIALFSSCPASPWDVVITVKNSRRQSYALTLPCGSHILHHTNIQWKRYGVRGRRRTRFQAHCSLMPWKGVRSAPL